jgi:predicted nucleic acid-binding protein
MLVDSSALIPLSRVGRLDLLRQVVRPVRTTRDVYRECVEEAAGRPGLAALEEAFSDWIEVVEHRRSVRAVHRLEGVERADASLLAACEAMHEDLLSNDAHLLRVAQARGLRGRWVTWLVIEARRRGLLGPREAKELVGNLVKEGMRLSPEVFAAVLLAIEAMGGDE